MLNEEIRDRIENKIDLTESDDSMGQIWHDHAVAHHDSIKAASKLHTFLSTRVPGHGLSQEYIGADPKSHEEVLDKIHTSGVSLSVKERDQLDHHINTLKEAQTRRQQAVDDHNSHPKFQSTVGGALMHGIFGKSGSSLSGKLNKKKDDSLNDMEHHSTLSPNSAAAHALRRQHGISSPTTQHRKVSGDDDEEQGGVLKRAAGTVGDMLKKAALDTLRNPDTSRSRRRK